MLQKTTPNPKVMLKIYYLKSKFGLKTVVFGEKNVVNGENVVFESNSCCSVYNKHHFVERWD